MTAWRLRVIYAREIGVSPSWFWVGEVLLRTYIGNVAAVLESAFCGSVFCVLHKLLFAEESSGLIVSRVGASFRCCLPAGAPQPPNPKYMRPVWYSYYGQGPTMLMSDEWVMTHDKEIRENVALRQAAVCF